MATLEKPRPRTTSITIALPTVPIRELRKSPVLHPLPLPPPSPLLRILDAPNGDASFVLPSVPTSEPSFHPSLYDPTIESDFSDRESEMGSVGSSGPATGRHAAGTSDFDGEIEEEIDEEEEEEEVLEELADDPIETAGAESGDRQQNDLAGLVLANQAAALLALQTLLQQMRKLAVQKKIMREEEEDPESADVTVDILDGAINVVSEISEQSEDRAQPLAKLNLLLDSLSTAALTAGSTSTSSTNDSVTLALALGDLIQSLDKIHLPNGRRAAVESAHSQARSPKLRLGSTSTLASISSHSPSASREELRNPFAETTEPNVFATLHRLISALVSRCPEQQRNVPRKGRSVDEARSLTNIFGSSATKPSLTRDDLALSETSAAAWSHISHILSLTRDLLASRRSANTYPFSFDSAGSYSPLRGRSRRSSAASSNTDVVERARSVASGHSLSGSRLQGQMVSTRGSLIRKAGSLSSLERASSIASGSLPPRYSDDGGSSRQRKGSGASEGQIRDYQARGLLPAYGLDDKISHRRSGSRSTMPYPEKGILLSSPTLSNSSEPALGLYTPAVSQSMEMVQTSHERVTTTASRLASQRASPKVGGHRSPNVDLNLDDLIDRLAASGKQLDDQRVAPKAKKVSSSVSVDPPFVSAKSSSSMLKRLSSTAQLAGTFRRSSTTTNAAGNGKERALAPPLSRPGSAGSGLPSGLSSLDEMTSRSKRSAPISLRAMLFKDSAADARLQTQSYVAETPAASETPSSSFQSKGSEETELFDLLAAAAKRTRLSDQEAVMRPIQRRYHTIAALGSTDGAQAPPDMSGFPMGEQKKAHSHDEDFRLGAGVRSIDTTTSSTHDDDLLKAHTATASQ